MTSVAVEISNLFFPTTLTAYPNMKIRNPFFLALGITLTAIGLSNSEAGTRGTGPMRDAVTHEHLSQSLRTAQQKDPVRELGPAIGKVDEDPAVKNTSRDLIKDSTILCYRGFLTLVPKRAVLHLPEKLKDRFEAKPNIQVQTWADFYVANRGWIRTIEVTREQAMGEVAMSEEIVKSFETSTSAIVATFKGGPISVLPVPEPTVKTDSDPVNPSPTTESKPAPTRKP